MQLLDSVYKRIIRLKLLLLCVAIIMITGCPIKKIFGIQCPTCGITRALLSLTKFDFINYCYYNIMAAPVLISIITIIMCKNIKIKKLSYLVLFINFFYYLIRTFFIHIYI